MSDKLTKALELVQQAYAERTNPDDPYHGGSLSGKEKTAWAKVISNLKNLAPKPNATLSNLEGRDD